MKTPQPVLTTATVAALALALLAGQNFVDLKGVLAPLFARVPSKAKANKKAAKEAPIVPQVAVPNARAGSELERREESYVQDFGRASGFELGRKAQDAADKNVQDLNEEDFLSALDADLEPWEKTPVEIGGPLGPQKSAVLIAKHKHGLG